MLIQDSGELRNSSPILEGPGFLTPWYLWEPQPVLCSSSLAWLHFNAFATLQSSFCVIPPNKIIFQQDLPPLCIFFFACSNMLWDQVGSMADYSICQLAWNEACQGCSMLLLRVATNTALLWYIYISFLSFFFMIHSTWRQLTLASLGSIAFSDHKDSGWAEFSGTSSSGLLGLEIAPL